MIYIYTHMIYIYIYIWYIYIYIWYIYIWYMYILFIPTSWEEVIQNQLQSAIPTPNKQPTGVNLLPSLHTNPVTTSLQLRSFKTLPINVWIRLMFSRQLHPSWRIELPQTGFGKGPCFSHHIKYWGYMRIFYLQPMRPNSWWIPKPPKGDIYQARIPSEIGWRL
jgi:hypothetical protein